MALTVSCAAMMILSLAPCWLSKIYSNFGLSDSIDCSEKIVLTAFFRSVGVPSAV